MFDGVRASATLKGLTFDVHYFPTGALRVGKRQAVFAAVLERIIQLEVP